MSTFIALMKREFWEQKRLLIWPPAIIGFITLGLTVSLLIVFSGEVSSSNYTQSTLSDDSRMLMSAQLARIISGAFLSVCGLTTLYYLAGSLYSDRKDRSILFWKSLPTTEIQTVFSKLSTGIFLFPAFAIAFTIVTIIGCYAVISTCTLFFDDHIAKAIIQGIGLSFNGLMIGISKAITISLYMSILSIPIFCYLLFVSAISRRSPLLFALIPYIVLLIVTPILIRHMSSDNWLITFLSNYSDLSPGKEQLFNSHIQKVGGLSVSYSNEISFGKMLSAFEFWVMMAISAVLLWATTIIRKNSSDLG